MKAFRSLALIFIVLLLLVCSVPSFVSGGMSANGYADPFALAGAPVPTPFTLLWVSDTQIMSGKMPERMVTMTDWVVDNAEDRNMVMLLHTGDIVDGPNNKT